jgi:hypothetical protein
MIYNFMACYLRREQLLNMIEADPECDGKVKFSESSISVLESSVSGLESSITMPLYKNDSFNYAEMDELEKKTARCRILLIT